MLEKFFKLKQHNTTVKTEAIASFATAPALMFILKYIFL